MIFMTELTPQRFDDAMDSYILTPWGLEVVSINPITAFN